MTAVIEVAIGDPFTTNSNLKNRMTAVTRLAIGNLIL